MNTRIIALYTLLVVSIICAPAVFGWSGNQGTQAIGDSPTSHTHAGASSGGLALTPLTIDVSSSAKMPAVTPIASRQIGFANDIFGAYVGGALRLYLYDLTAGTGIVETGTGGTRTLAIDPSVVVTDPAAATTWATCPAGLSVAETNIDTHSVELVRVGTAPAAVSALQDVALTSDESTWVTSQTTRVGLAPALATAVVTVPSGLATAETNISSHALAIASAQAALATERTTAALVFSAADSVVVTNTNALCSITPTAAIGSQSLTANTVTTGAVYDVDVWCLLRTKASAPGNLTVALNVGGSAVCSVTMSPGNGWIGKPMHLSNQVTVRAAGASGYVISQGDGAVAGVSALGAAPTGNTTVAVDFSAEVSIIPTFQWATADVDNSIIVQQVTIKRAQ